MIKLQILVTKSTQCQAERWGEYKKMISQGVLPWCAPNCSNLTYNVWQSKGRRSNKKTIIETEYVDVKGVLVSLQLLSLEQRLRRKSGVFLIWVIQAKQYDPTINFLLRGIDLLLAELGYGKLHNRRRGYVLQWPTFLFSVMSLVNTVFFTVLQLPSDWNRSSHCVYQ